MVKIKVLPYISILLLLLGAYFNTYYYLIGAHSRIIQVIISALLLGGGTRHWLFFGLPLIMLGYCINNKYIINKKTINNFRYYVILVVSSICSFIESYLLMKIRGTSIHLDITLFNWIPALAIVMLIVNVKHSIIKLPITGFNWKILRKTCDICYIVHVAVISLCRALGFKLILNFFISIIGSFTISYILYFIIIDAGDRHC